MTTRRLFEGPDAAPPPPREAPGLWIPTLLEDGDSEDLRGLFDELGSGTVAAWFETRGGRQLSRRSRAFWAVVLDRRPRRPPAIAEELWRL